MHADIDEMSELVIDLKLPAARKGDEAGRVAISNMHCEGMAFEIRSTPVGIPDVEMWTNELVANHSYIEIECRAKVVAKYLVSDAFGHAIERLSNTNSVVFKAVVTAKPTAGGIVPD